MKTETENNWINFKAWNALRKWYTKMHIVAIKKYHENEVMKELSNKDPLDSLYKPDPNQEVYKIVLDESWYNYKNILDLPKNYDIEITKLYKFTWWKKILLKLGFKFHHFDCIIINKENKTIRCENN